MNSKLAILGGSPEIQQPLAEFKSVGSDEIEAATRVIKSGNLSAYIGAPGEGFMGGPEVRNFEKQAAEYFGVKHAIVVNSWTSGLIAAVGAMGIEPGDEVITTPWTMSATAMAVLHYNALPVFADIDRDTFNIDPEAVRKLITPRTRAIMSVDIFGQSADMQELRKICDEYGLGLISDTAQAPGAKTGDQFAGTLADIGGYSLNYHKHIHSGEGGILVTNSDKYARKLQLIRNHAESVIKSSDPAELVNMIGFNFRMGEIEAAIASVQLSKLEERIRSRMEVASQLRGELAGLDGLELPQIQAGNTHVYYVFGIKISPEKLGVDRDTLVSALKAEGVPGIMSGYQNIHLLPAFREKIAFGSKGFPWTLVPEGEVQDYKEGLCPVAETLHANEFFGINVCMYEFDESDVKKVGAAFRKVWANLSELS